MSRSWRLGCGSTLGCALGPRNWCFWWVNFDRDFSSVNTWQCQGAELNNAAARLSTLGMREGATVILTYQDLVIFQVEPLNLTPCVKLVEPAWLWVWVWVWVGVWVWVWVWGTKSKRDWERSMWNQRWRGSWTWGWPSSRSPSPSWCSGPPPTSRRQASIHLSGSERFVKVQGVSWQRRYHGDLQLLVELDVQTLITNVHLNLASINILAQKCQFLLLVN